MLYSDRDIAVQKKSLREGKIFGSGREGRWGGGKGVCIGFVVAAAVGTGRPEPGEEGWGAAGMMDGGVLGVGGSELSLAEQWM